MPDGHAPGFSENHVNPDQPCGCNLDVTCGELKDGSDCSLCTEPCNSEEHREARIAG